jgi:hypothetical protein
MEMTYSVHRKLCLRIALAASAIGAVGSAVASRSVTCAILAPVVIFVAARVGVAKGNQAMRRTGTENEGDYMSAEATGCVIGLLLGVAVSAGLVAIFSSR